MEERQLRAGIRRPWDLRALAVGFLDSSETSWTDEKGHLVWPVLEDMGEMSLNGFVQGRASSKVNISRSIKFEAKQGQVVRGGFGGLHPILPKSYPGPSLLASASEYTGSEGFAHPAPSGFLENHVAFVKDHCKTLGSGWRPLSRELVRV